MLDFPKLWYKFIGAILFHVSHRCTIILLYENEESPSLQAMCDSFLAAKTRQGSDPPAGPPKLNNSHGESTFPKIWVNFPNLAAPRSRATEFSWTSRFQNANPHIIISKRYNFDQNPPGDLKAMIYFPKFWNKFVGAVLDPVLPR